MIRRPTWVLLAIFGLSLIFAIWWVRSREEPLGFEPTADVTPPPALLWELAPEQIVGIRIEPAENGEVVEAERDEEALWVLISPEAPLADVARIERAVTWLQAPQPRGEIFDPGNLADFGLDPPQATIRVRLADGSERVLLVGRDAPTGNAVYALIPGSESILLFSPFGIEEVTGMLETPPIATPTATPTETAVPEGTPEPATTP